MVRVVSKTGQKLIVQRQSGGFDNMAYSLLGSVIDLSITDKIINPSPCYDS